MNYLGLDKSSSCGISFDKIISKALSNLEPICSFNPHKLKLSLIKLSSTSQKNSWPSISQNQFIHPSELSSELSSLSII
jgi:hypothetical protein